MKSPTAIYRGLRRRVFGNRQPRVEQVVRKTDAVRPEKMLMIAYFDPNGLGTVKDNVLLWAEKSRFKFDLINLYHGEYSNGLALPSDLDLSQYSGIVVHCTVAYNIHNLYSLDSLLKMKLQDYDGLKIIMKQDEHYKPHLVSQYLKDKGFDIVISVAPTDTWPMLYPHQKNTSVEFVPTLTGFISEEMLSWRFPEDREIDIVYRGSPQPFTFGRLGYDKLWIGEEFIGICQRKGLKCDISSRWEDRVFGQDWFRFLGSSKGTIGVESGASLVDFVGDVEKQFAIFMKNNPGADFDFAYENLLKQSDGNVQYRAIAPRHFEAIVSRTAQLLVKGHYSGVLEADRHYFALDADLRNVDDVLARFLDPIERRKVVECAYEEVALNKKYQYSWFIQDIDNRLEAKFDRGIS